MPFPPSPSSKTARDRGDPNPGSCPNSPWVWRSGARTLAMGLQERSSSSRGGRRDREVAVAYAIKEA